MQLFYCFFYFIIIFFSKFQILTAVLDAISNTGAIRGLTEEADTCFFMLQTKTKTNTEVKYRINKKVDHRAYFI